MSARFRSGILGVALERPVRAALRVAGAGGVLLLVNGLLMFLGERLRRRRRDRKIEALTLRAERLRRLRTIARIAARHFALGRLDGRGIALRSRPRERRPLLVSARDAGDFGRGAARDSQALRTRRAPRPRSGVVGGIAAGVAAYFSVAFLTRYFRSNDLRPFGWYCVVVGAVCFILARMGVIT